MATHRPSLSRNAPGKRLIENAQEYLRQWLLGEAPDAYLTHQWEHFFSAYSEVLRGMARRFRLSRDETDDVVQEVWSEVYSGLPKLQWQEHGPGHGLRAWLYKLVQSKSIDCIRRKLRRPLKLVGRWNGAEPVDPASGPHDHHETAWDREWICRIVARMKDEISAENHRLLTLRLVERRSIGEVAQVLNLTKSQIKFRQNRMLRRLRGELAVFRGVPFDDLPEAAGLPKKI